MLKEGQLFYFDYVKCINNYDEWFHSCKNFNGMNGLRTHFSYSEK